MTKNRVSFYLSRMATRGFGSEQVLSGTGLTEADVDRADFHASPDQYRTVIRNMLRLTGDPYLGIALGSSFKISDLGILGYAALSSETLAQARDVLTRYHRLNEYILAPSNYIHDGKWYMEIHESFPLGELAPFAVEEFVSRTIALSSSLTGRPFPILEMRLAYPAPKSLAPYRRRFDCALFFEQPKNLVLMDIQRLNDRIVMADPEVFRICETQCRQRVSQLAGSEPLSDKITNILFNMPGQYPSLNEMAEKLRMSPRSLRRHLAGEGVTYQALLDSTRRELALQYLKETTLTPKEIGYLLGYTNVNNFRRAFRGWTGRRLSEFRQ